jgi:molecular chaperone GrpE (heat shock protein)
MKILIYEKLQNMLPPPDLAAEIETLQEELLIERERNLRTFADFRNYRRRVEHDVRRLVDASHQGMLNPVLNIINDMQDLCSTNTLSVINLI